VWVDDPDGNTFLDFTSGIAVCNTGHCHPEVVEAAKDQLDRLIHTCGADFYHAPMIEVAEELAAIAPGESKKRIFLGNSGAEAVEAGFKLARWHSGRQKALAFLGAFHGRTMGALTLTASKAVQKRKFGPLLPGVTHVPYAYCYRCVYNLTYPECDFACVRFIEDELFKTIVPPEEVALIVVEAIQGKILQKGLETIKDQFECIGDIRGLGLMQAAEFVMDRHTKKPDKKIRDLMLRKCFENGLLLLSCGDSTIRFCPPLITTSEQIEVGLEIFLDVLKTVAG
jgi:4-aminobutyrate aminotransferase-like enzyme